MKAKIIEIFSEIFNAGMDAQEVGMPSFDQIQQTGWFNDKIAEIESLFKDKIDSLQEDCQIYLESLAHRYNQIDKLKKLANKQEEINRLGRPL